MSIFALNKDIAQVVVQVSSDKCVVRLDDLNESIENYRENLAPDRKYMTNVTVKAFAIDENEEKIMDVGLLNAIFFESEVLFGEELSFPMLCDMVSSDACEMAEAATDSQGRINPDICDPEHNMLYIKKIYVEESCRGHGVGRYLLDNLVPLLSHSLNLRLHACTLLPYPQVKTEHGYIDRATGNVDEELARLIRFYEKVGYAKIDGSKCMYKKFTDELDDLYAMLRGEEPED